MGLAVIALAGSAAFQAYLHSAAAQRILTLSRLDQALFLAVQQFRFERGTMDLLLTLEPDQSPRDVQFALRNRTGVDASLGQALDGLDGLEIAGLRTATDTLKGNYRLFQDLRRQVDQMIRLPVGVRDSAFKSGFMPQTTRLQDSIEAVSSILESEMRRLNPPIGDLIQAKTAAWVTRSTIGASILTFNAAISEHRSFTTTEHGTLLFRKGIITNAWELVRHLAEDPNAPRELKTAFTNAQAGFFNGQFAELYNGLFENLSSNGLPQITLPAWRAQTEEPQLSVGRVSVVAMELIARQAETIASRAWIDAACFLLALIAAIALAASGLFLVMFRVSRPITEMTSVMRRLADDEVGIAVPYVGRSDEIGDMAAAVQVFKDSLIRRHALEAEAIKSREQAIALANTAAQERDRAEAASKAKSEFLANMNHELRTPLNAILGYAHILREASPGERQARALDTIVSSGRHLLALINDVLDFSKIEANKLELRPHVIKLTTVIEHVADVIGVMAQEKGLAFSLKLADDLPVWVRADELHLRQILFNLLGNAIKFTDCGQVTLRASKVASRGIVSVVRFGISDTGTGIEAQNLTKIFSPFEQAGEERQRCRGTGLGLSISQRLVRLMGGELNVESTVGEGSIFWFEIPLPDAEPQQMATATEQAIVGYQGEPRRLLVVDDNAVNRALLVDMLVPLGFVVDQAENGEAALRQAETSQPDLILTDIVMPEMDGLELIQHLRAHAILRALPIVVVSASASDTDQGTALQSGANAFLGKPVEQDELLQTLGAQLELSWVLEATQPVQPEDLQDLVVPGHSELRVLHEFAQDGDMLSIRRWADRIAAADHRLTRFADELRQLALSYQSRKILQVVERHLLHEEA